MSQKNGFPENHGEMSGAPPAQWAAPAGAQLDLLYLNWGMRRHGQAPSRLGPHQGWVYAFVLKGNPSLQSVNGAARLQPGQCVVIHPACSSGWTDAPQGVSELLTWVWLTPPRCEECAPPENAFRAFQLDRVLRHRVRQLHGLCRGEVERPDSLTKLQIEQARLQLDLLLARSARPKITPPQSSLRVQFALRWLAQNLDEPRPVSALCDYLQVSQATLNRLFRAHLGTSLAAYHHRLKMERASEWLADGKIAVKQISLALGYRHSNDFSRAYKKSAGVNPRKPSAASQKNMTPLCRICGTPRSRHKAIRA
jgi:AraC-like DNA-binding protein